MAVPDTFPDEQREERICAGCSNTVESADLRQMVVSFGNALWHPECFRCAKCNKLVDGGSSLLLLSDGNPLCSDCTFTCGVCHKSIIDEAITTGSDAYHAECFKCRACREPIQEVVFAKTKDAVFCMACHNIRIARSRKKQEMRARQREANGEPHRSHRDRSRDVHRREKEAVPPMPTHTPARRNESPAPADVDSGHGDSPMASQADITSGAKRLSLIQSTATGIPPPPLSPHRGANGSSNPRLKPQSSGTFPSEAYSKNTLTPSHSPRNSTFPQNAQNNNNVQGLRQGDGLTPMWQQQQQQQQKDRSAPGSAPRSPTSTTVHHTANNHPHLHPHNQNQSMQPQPHPQTPQRKESKRSFNPLDAIIDGMERPYTPRTKTVSTGGKFKVQEGTYDDISGDGIPDALKEYFQEVEDEPPASSGSHTQQQQQALTRLGSALSNGHLQQPRSFFDASTNPSVQSTPEPGHRPLNQRSASTDVVEIHVKGTPSMSSSRRHFEAYDGVEESLPISSTQQQYSPPPSSNTLITPQAWLGSPSRSRPGTANRDVGSAHGSGSGGSTSIFTHSQSNKLNLNPHPERPSLSTSSSSSSNQTFSAQRSPRSPRSPHSPDNYFQHHPHSSPNPQLRTPTDPYAHKPNTPTTPLTADGVIRPPPASIPRGVTAEFEEGEDSDFQSPVMKVVDPSSEMGIGEGTLVLSPTQLPMQELLVEEPGEMPTVAAAAAAASSEQPTENVQNQNHIQRHSAGSTPSSEHPQPRRVTSPSRPDTSTSETLSEDSQPPEGVDRSSTASPTQRGGLRKKRKHDEKPPALPPIRISQFYVGSPTKGSGIELSQGPGLDDSFSSSEGKQRNNSRKEAGMESVLEEGEDSYIMVQSQSDKDKREIHLNSPRTTVQSLEHRSSEDTPTTSEQSHDNITNASTSQTSISSAGLGQGLGPRPEASRSSSNGSIDTMTTLTKMNNSAGNTVQRSGSRGSQGEVQGHAQSNSSSSASSGQNDEIYQVVLKSLNDLIDNANKHEKSIVKLDLKFVEVIRKCLQSERTKHEELKGNVESMKRQSLSFVAGLSATQQEYDRELATRRDAQTEVRRLRVLVQEQAAKLSALAGEQRKRDMLEQNSKEISTNLVGLEKEMSKLKVERDMTMAEMAELKSPITAGLDTHSFEATGTRLSKALSVRFDGIKSQYKRQLEPLTEQREGLMREINELSESRKAILEETAALHARNEELMGLNSQLSRNIENQVFQQSTSTASELFSSGTPPAPPAKSFSASTSSYSEENSRTLRGRPMDSVDHNRGGLFKWSSKNRELATPNKSESNSPSPMGMIGFQKAIKFVPHAFQQMALLRVSRCDHCNDKMWGSQSRCQACGISIHPRCANHVKTSCPGTQAQDGGSGVGTVFGRDLIEQVRLDAGDSARLIPVIVEKCIQVIEMTAMDYEGLYRKSGGSGQIKIIEGLFEKGHYEAIDLMDSNVISDISSVTSVLKSYFRELPNPLLTSALHESFIDALTLKDINAKVEAISNLARQLPREHYETVKFLMLHLNQVQAHRVENRMDSKNLGLVFGPTLMRSADVTREFGDMAGKTQTIELLVDHAPTIFRN